MQAGDCGARPGTTYEVSYTEDTFTNLLPSLALNPWWGPGGGPLSPADIRAISFASAVADGLGLPNTGGDPFGPIFSYSADVNFPSNNNGRAVTTVGTVTSVYAANGTVYAYALARPVGGPVTSGVPAPLPVCGAGVALGWSRRLRRRIREGRSTTIS
ncbi:MAG: hypothetical protein ER33_15805 [Cyanobium sp. CACIAM 14]|nr:MAG: hypothetical protein ER33_15805 [Cyanobium sp. CACIAM 14]